MDPHPGTPMKKLDLPIAPGFEPTLDAITVIPWVAGSDHSNKLFSIKEHPISNGFQVLWGCFQARNIGHNHSSVHGA